MGLSFIGWPGGDEALLDLAVVQAQAEQLDIEKGLAERRGIVWVQVALIRQLMWRMLGAVGPHVAHAIESPLIEHRRQSADATEGVEAFMQKRAAQFPDQVSHDMPPSYPWWNASENG